MEVSNKKKYLFLLIPIVLILCVGGFLLFSHHDSKDTNDKEKIKKDDIYTKGEFGKCPKDLSGILTHSFVDPDTIAALIPLGNSNPPTHTFPVDHVYFINYNEEGNIPKIAFYAPADSTITKIQSDIGYDSNGKEMKFSYAISFTLCNGLKVVSGGETELMPALKKVVDNTKGDCKTYQGKEVGEATFTQCQYELNYKVKSGDQVAWTGGDAFPEVWAYNYNNKRDPNVNWYIYNYPDYGYSFCLFDLYKGNLKTELYSKFGAYLFNPVIKDEETNKIIESPSKFIPRTVEPLCGKVNQNIVGTIQGTWYDLSKGSDNIEFSGMGMSLIHDNIDSVLGKIVVGGNIVSNPGMLSFLPKHTGYINREFSEVKADNKIYCYEHNPADLNEHVSYFYMKSIQKKVLMQLVDNHHLKVEAQDGNCGNNETFIKPFNYER